jgi:hypothetical protein
MKLMPIILIAAFISCSNNKTIKNNYKFINTEFKIDSECINKTRKIAIDSLKTDNLIYETVKLKNGSKFINYSVKNKLNTIIFGIDDSCNIDTILMDSSEITSECHFK